MNIAGSRFACRESCWVFRDLRGKALLVGSIDLFLLSVLDEVHLEGSVGRRDGVVHQNDLIVEHVLEVLVSSSLCHERHDIGAMLVQGRNEELAHLLWLGLVKAEDHAKDGVPVLNRLDVLEVSVGNDILYCEHEHLTVAVVVSNKHRVRFLNTIIVDN